MLSMYAPQQLAKEIQFFLDKQTQNGSDHKQSMSKCNTVAFTEIAVIDFVTLAVFRGVSHTDAMNTDYGQRALTYIKN